MNLLMSATSSALFTVLTAILGETRTQRAAELEALFSRSLLHLAIIPIVAASKSHPAGRVLCFTANGRSLRLLPGLTTAHGHRFHVCVTDSHLLTWMFA